jgi:hypothetical protein
MFKQTVEKIVASLLAHVESLETHAFNKGEEALRHAEQVLRIQQLETAAHEERLRAGRIAAKLKELLA